MIMPIIVPHIASSGGGAVSAAGFAAALTFGSIVALKVLVCLMIASVPVGAIFGYLQDGLLFAFMVAVTLPLLIAGVWLICVAMAQGLMWVIA